jgi:hypothetical protein
MRLFVVIEILDETLQIIIAPKLIASQKNNLNDLGDRDFKISHGRLLTMPRSSGISPPKVGRKSGDLQARSFTSDCGD